MRKVVLGAILTLVSVLVIGSVPAFAASNPFGDACSHAGTSGSAACNASSSNPIAGSDGLIAKVTNIVATVGGIAAVIIIIIAGIKYITSGGDSSATASAKNTIIFASVGLLIIALAREIVIFIVDRV